VTSDFSPEVEMRPFRACAMHPVIIIGTVRSLWTWLWGRYHVPQNAFLVFEINRPEDCSDLMLPFQSFMGFGIVCLAYAFSGILLVTFFIKRLQTFFITLTNVKKILFERFFASTPLLYFSIISCIYSYAIVSLHIAINDVAGEWVYHVGDILYEFLGHNLVSVFRTLKPNINQKT